MKQAVVKSVKAGNPFESQHGTLYGWWVTLDNNDNISVNTQKQDVPPWKEGDTAFYEITKTHQGKKGPWHSAKKVKNPMEGGSSYSGGSGSGHSGWSPEKERSIMTQGLLKSIIESGAAVAEWEGKLVAAIALHDKLNAKPAAPAVAEAPQAVPAVKHSITAPEEDDDLPF